MAPRFTLGEVEAAAQPIRFELLGRRGWFRASDVAGPLGVQRGTVRQHAAVLAQHGLLEERAIPGDPLGTLEWRARKRGGELRRRISVLIGRSYRQEDSASGVVSLIAITADSGVAGSLSDTLGELARAAVHEVPGYLADLRPRE
jgi:hypothetical protein